MISFDEALGRLAEVARPLGSETVSLDEAPGRVLASAVVARISSPRSDVSAMDGYAVRDADLGRFPARLQLVGESFAGGGWSGTLQSGQCVRIFTGAPVPDGADRVVIQEDVRRDGEAAMIDDDPGEAIHIRRQGGDFVKGDALLSPGRLIDPRAIVAAAASDVSELLVHKGPRVHILSTGDELAEPGKAADGRDTIPESVSFGVAALARQWGAAVTGRTRLRDDLQAMSGAARDAIETADLIIVTGGASVGEKDFAKTMFEPLGLELLFSKVALKPGKPVWLGRAGKAIVLGLPGNPTSALVTGRLLLAPLLAGLSGRDLCDALRWHKASLAAPLRECGARETFHRARWRGERVEIFANQDSSAQKILAQADLLVRQRPHAPTQGAGTPVEVLDF